MEVTIKIDYTKTDPEYIKSPNFHKGRYKPVELIVIHTVEASEKGNIAESVAKNWFGKKESRASSHYVIDNNSIVQCVYDSNTAWHCKNANSNGIGLEHAGYAKQTKCDWADEYSLLMLDNSAQIAAYICNKFNIPVQRAEFAGDNNPTVIKKGFCGHADVPLHGSHWDPGENFPWDNYLKLVQKYLDTIGGE